MPATRGIFQLHARERRTDAALLSGFRALQRHARHLRKLGVDALVLPPVVKEILQGRPVLAPCLQRKLGDLGELPVVIRQFALAPVMHHQQQVGPVLRVEMIAEPANENRPV